jgi:hypothetical protein
VRTSGTRVTNDKTMSQVDQYLHEPSDFDEAEALLAQSLVVAGQAEREPPGIGRVAMIELSVVLHRAGQTLSEASVSFTDRASTASRRDWIWKSCQSHCVVR